jgi:hypothetical protein
MNIKVFAAGLCLAAIAVTAVAVPPVEAQTTKKKYAYTTTRVARADRPRARVVVVPRSFLDAGTEVQPGERKFTDYAFPPSGNAGIGISAVTNTGGKVGWDRSPMMQPGQLGGFNPW